MEVTTISPQELQKRCDSGARVDVIDVRTPAEFGEIHIPIASNLPLDRLDPAAIIQSRNGSNGEPLYVICRSGTRARKACEQFIAAGYQNVTSVEGGTLAWEQAGLPVVRGRKAMSLERQVRIVAGALVVTGAVLAVTVNEYFALLSGFVGAGLMFAGITDSCAMAMMLARMPWNQASGQGATCAK